MSTVQPIRSAHLGGSALGAAKQLLNELLAIVRVPSIAALRVPAGDVFEPMGAAQRAGADAVERLMESLGTARHDVDPQRAMSTRPLLASTSVRVTDAHGTTRLRFAATAPGADFSINGRESGMVAVYVDGVYHSTMPILAERTGDYVVNLGAMALGEHRIELRAATDIAPVQPIVTTIAARATSGEQAVIDRQAPVLELRDSDRSVGYSPSHSDIPLVLVPAITRYPDGRRLIEYRVMFSNEDGGTPTPSLMSGYGRTIDAEPIYRVLLEASGKVLGEHYQAALHKWLPYDGSRDPSGRPMLRVSTANNLVSARVHIRDARAERWSEAAADVIEGPASDYDVMSRASWTWKIMALELLREGKATAGDAIRGARQIGDPRSYIYLSPLSDAARAALQIAGGMEVVLNDGRRVLARVASTFAIGAFAQTALELPAGVAATAIAGISLAGVRATVLDALFGAREVQTLSPQ